MCHQAVGLIQAEIERRGITTASITVLPEVTRAVRPPRALAVPFALGYPLGAPDEPQLQLEILRALLALLPDGNVPVLRTAPTLNGGRPDTTRGRPSTG
jgi:hypothetical protein